MANVNKDGQKNPQTGNKERNGGRLKSSKDG